MKPRKSGGTDNVIEPPRKYVANDVQIAVAGGFMSVGEFIEHTPVTDGYMGDLARDMVSKDGQVILARKGDRVIADGKGGYSIESSLTGDAAFKAVLHIERKKAGEAMERELANRPSLHDMLPKK